MISNATIVTCFISLLIAVVLPIAAILLYAGKFRGEKLFIVWLLGAAGFFVTQILIRVPILSALYAQDWFMSFSEKHGFLFAFSLAFTAGLFELAGRFAVAKSIQRTLTFRRSIAAGLGHGGIEAILLIGSSYIINLVLIFLIRTGTFDSLITHAAAGVDASQFSMLKDSLMNTQPAMFLLGGYERILSMVCHLAMSLIVCYSLHIGKAAQGALVCLGIHTMIDLSACINLLTGTVLSQTAVYLIIYTNLTVAAVISGFLIKQIHIRWTDKEASYESERA